jgi:hypothetical protein
MIIWNWNFRQLISAIIVSSVLIGCTAQVNPIRLTQAITSTVQENIGPSPSIPPIALTTTTTLVPTQNGEATSAPKSTLTNDQRKIFYIDKIKNPSECLLPCIFEIVPGKTNWNKSLDFFRQMGSKIATVDLANDEILHGIGGMDILNEKVYQGMDIIEYNDMISKLHIRAEGYSNPKYFQDLWSQYSPIKILDRYGVQDRSYLFVAYNKGYGANPANNYFLWLVYDKLGFYIKYEGFVDNKEILHICPALSNPDGIQALDIYVSASGYPLNLMNKIDGTQDYDSKSMLVIEDAAGLTNKELYERIINGDKNGCFDSSLALWVNN